MTGSMRSYRDDGPLAGLIARGLGVSRLPAVALTAVGAGALLSGLAVDGPRTGVATAVGFAVFLVCAAWAGVPRAHERIGWLVPPALRLAEYGFAVWLGWRWNAAAVVYGLLAAVAFHHYDVVYRVRHLRAAPPRWLFLAGGGWDLRMTALLAGSALGVLAPVAAALAVWCAVLFAVESVRCWTSVARIEQRRPLAQAGQ